MALWIIGMNHPTSEELDALPDLIRSLQGVAGKGETGEPEYRMAEYTPSYLH